ncbi:hypothetical protein VTN77DRAFT_8875 [Rasamsonia byssochlamydoides]|uniref:uncharacterized protein n=1 Tax=Rasamsonia byssochlamydoides TaxID=89139 RepID=UPI003744B02B
MAKIYRSATPDLQLHDVDLVSFIHSNPQNTPLDRLMYVDALTGKGYTLQEVFQRTRSLAHGLRDLGVRPHDVVAFLSPNTIDYAVTCHAVIGCGAAVSPTSAALTALELRAQLKTSNARYMIVHSSLILTARKAAKGTSVQKIIQADGHSAVDGIPTAHMLATSCPPSELTSIAPYEAEDRVAFICFSSGTSGPAKGVMITHKNVTANIQQWQKHLGEEDDASRHLNVVAFLPFNHIYGLNLYICTGLIKGSTVVVLPRFDLEVYLSCIQRYRPEELALVPPVALLLVKSPVVRKYDLSSVRKIASAAAPLTKELATAVEGMFKQAYGTTVYCTQAWGLTETSPLATATPPHRMVDKRFTVGCIAPNMEFRFVDPETMQDAQTKADGSTELAEIWCRGPNVTKGYYNNEKATLNAFYVDEDGRRWFRTGDIGSIDADGFVTISDRIKEMIKYKGLQVIPSELEGKLLEHADVADAAVVGVWVEEQATELPVGFVVLRQGRAQTDQAKKKLVEGIHHWLNQRVANHKRLRGGIRIVDAIPKSPSGKILRRQLKELVKEELKMERRAKL